MGLGGRSERIRTSGPCVPNTVLYQAELHSGEGAYSGRRTPRQAATDPNGTGTAGRDAHRVGGLVCPGRVGYVASLCTRP